MNILYLITGLGLGGAEKVVTSLADKMHQQGHKVKIAYLKGSVSVFPQSPDIELIYLGLETPKNFFNATKKYKELIKNYQPDIIHSHMVHANIFARIIRFFVKIPVLISTAHNKNEGGKFRMFLYRITDKLATISTNVSQEAVDSFITQKATTQNRMITIYNGIDTNIYSYDGVKRKEKRDEINIHNDTPLILAVGRLTEAKDYPNLLHAFSKLNLDKQPKLVIIGDGQEKENLQHLANSLNISQNIIWLGIRHDVQEWMSACDLFVLSSAWEGFGLVVAEAMACERLVIGTDSGGVKEVINKYGLVIPPKNTSALTAGITQYLALSDDDKNILEKQARNHIVDTFSIEKISQEWLDIYNNLLNNKNN